jgi:hypothetical protein
MVGTCFPALFLCIPMTVLNLPYAAYSIPIILSAVAALDASFNE